MLYPVSLWLNCLGRSPRSTLAVVLLGKSCRIRSLILFLSSLLPAVKIDSPPLATITNKTLLESNNLFAEVHMLTLGAHSSLDPRLSTYTRGLAEVRSICTGKFRHPHTTC